MSNDRLLTDAEIVEIILGPTTPGEYESFAPSVLAIWCPRFDRASAKTADAMQVEINKLQQRATDLEDCLDGYVDNDEYSPIDVQLRAGNVALRAKGQALANALHLAINAFQKNWAIDWGELDAVLASWNEKDLSPHPLEFGQNSPQ